MEKSQKEPWEMMYEEFAQEYKTLMQNVADKQVHGRMDTTSPTFKDITMEEFKVLQNDWKEFSRIRGFTEDDIVEYERWRTVSGQRDFEDISAIFGSMKSLGLELHTRMLYLRFIDFAEDKDLVISANVLNSYDEVKEYLEKVSLGIA